MRLFWTLIILIIIAFPTLAQETDDRADLCYENNGIPNFVTGQCELRVSLDINVIFPVEYATMPFVMEVINPLLNEKITGFMDMFAEADIQPSFGSSWSLNVGYEEIRHSDTVFTIALYENMYTGGAHGINFATMLTFDTEAKTLLSLDDVLADVPISLSAIAPIAVTQILDNLGDFADVDWIADGTDPTNLNNYATWAITSDGLLFYFGDYHVAPYAAGPQTVVIPFADLSGMLESDFVISS